VRNIGDLPQLGGVYSAQILKYSKKYDHSSDNESEFEDDDQVQRPNQLLKLPIDGSIFHDGIPFHHFALSNLKKKHINRLKRNGKFVS
jgi:hypothetical protein